MADTQTIYIVSKIRTVPYEGSVAAVIENTQHLSRTSAESKYYSVLAAAANDTGAYVSSGVLMTNEGFVIESKTYKHDVQPQPEEGE